MSILTRLDMSLGATGWALTLRSQSIEVKQQFYSDVWPIPCYVTKDHRSIFNTKTVYFIYVDTSDGTQYVFASFKVSVGTTIIKNTKTRKIITEPKIIIYTCNQ